MKKYVALLLALVMSLTLLAACGGEDTGTPQDNPGEQQEQQGQEEQQPQEQVNARVQEIEDTLMEQIGEMPEFNGDEKLGALVISLTNPYWVGMKEAYEAAAEQYGVDIEVMSAPTEGDKQSQLETLQGMALKDYDAIRCV